MDRIRCDVVLSQRVSILGRLNLLWTINLPILDSDNGRFFPCFYYDDFKHLYQSPYQPKIRIFDEFKRRIAIRFLSPYWIFDKSLRSP